MIYYKVFRFSFICSNFLNSKSLNDEEKVEVLKTLKSILEESKQSSIGINDSLTRWRYNKQHKAQLSYNV